MLEKYPNVKFDLTPGWEMYDGFAKDADFWHDFFEENSERIIFGTDDHDRREAYRHKNIHKSVYSILTHDKTDFNISTYTKTVFQMYDAEHATVELKCTADMMKVIIDRFGEDITIQPGEDEEHFHITEPVAACSTFYSWIFNYKGKIKIIAPEEVKQEFNDMLREFL